MNYPNVFVQVFVYVSIAQLSLSRSQLSRDSKSIKTLYVIPSDADTDTEQCQASECHTLAFYMNQSIGNLSEYFNSYETYVFWNGTHGPLKNSTVVIRNATNLTLVGLSSFEQNENIDAVIDCNGESVGFVFRETSNITIKNLMFTSCVRSYSTVTHTDGHALATLAFHKGINLFLTKVTLQGSVDEAIYVKDIQSIVHFKEIKIVNATSKVWRSMNVISNHECNNNSLKVIIEDSIFIGNSLQKSVEDNDIKYENKNSNHKVPFAAGLSITLKCLNVNVKIDNVTMKNNRGMNGGNLALIFHNTSSTLKNAVTVQNSVLESGEADSGAGMYVEFVEVSRSQETLCLHSVNKSKHQLLLVENTVFRNNTAEYVGGGVYLRQKQSVASCSIGLIIFVNCTFEQNSVFRKGFGGTAFHSINYPLVGYRHHGLPQFNIQLIKCNFSGNNAEKQHINKVNIPSSGNGVIFTKSDSFFRLSNVIITNNNSSGILAIGSNVILSDNISISHNSASSGGGMLLCGSAVLYFDLNTTVTIEHNQVQHTGGGISVETVCLQSQPMCFFQLNDTIPYNDAEAINSIQVYVHNNTAGFAGHNLFGGSVDHCFILDHPQHLHEPNQSVDIFKSIFKLPDNYYLSSSVTSDPQRVCLCERDRPNCDHLFPNLEEYPGKQFTIQAALIGQFQGIVPGTAEARLTGSGSINKNERVQKLSSNSSCSTLAYTVYTNGSNVQLKLRAQHSGDVSGYEQLNNYKNLFINVTIKKCPPVFRLVERNGKVSCDCVHLRLNDKITCDINKQVIKRESSVWIGYLNSTGTTLYHGHCPFSYCVENVIYLSSSDIMLYSDNYSAVQSNLCAHNRTGVLCGKCSRGLSVTLGSPVCKKCSNYSLLLLIVVALSGALLVLTLTALNITITEGYLSGILFFCNIINSNISIFFPPHNNIYLLTSVLKFFVSSLSLTMSGWPLCLYNGMDAYSLAWLGFAYPFYIWLLSGLLIYFGDKFNWLVRKNSVKVLATLIILSYSILLHSVIQALLATRMYSVNSIKHDSEYLWLKDGNIKYFQGKHIPLVVFSSLLGLILLPFTFCLLCIQCLLRVSHYRPFSWVNRLKPFFDAYTGPFTPKARFWTGLLLLSRIIVFGAFAINLTGNQRTNIGIIGFISVVLLFVSLLLKSELYKRHYLSIIEQAMLFNLGVLSIFTLSITHKTFMKIVTNLCVGIAFATFIAVIVHHTRARKLIQRPLKWVWLSFLKKCASLKRKRLEHTSEEDEDYYQGVGDNFPPLAQFDQAREPLLN